MKCKLIVLSFFLFSFGVKAGWECGGSNYLEKILSEEDFKKISTTYKGNQVMRASIIDRALTSKVKALSKIIPKDEVYWSSPTGHFF